MWRVRARTVGRQGGFWRGGRFWPESEWTVVPDEEMTDAIREEPALLVEAMTPEAGSSELFAKDKLDLPASCAGVTRTGAPCKAKPIPGEIYCPAHRKRP